MIYLDTHVIVWLYAGLIEKLSSFAIKLIEDNELLISPIIKLELVYLHETKKITESANVILHALKNNIGLNICTLPFDEIVNKATAITWTRDPFDRLILASALSNQKKLLTKDKIIRKHFKLAVWD